MLVSDLARQIVTGERPSGSVLPAVEQLSTQFGVSRTAMREALRVLSAKGLIQPRQKTGTHVCELADWNLLDPDVLSWMGGAASPMFLDQVMQVRMIIEPAAASLVAQLGDPGSVASINDAFAAMEACARGDLESFVEADLAFHLAILDATGNPLLVRMEMLISTGVRAAMRRTNFDVRDRLRSVPVHAGVAAAIAEGLPDRAERNMRDLVSGAWADLRGGRARRAPSPKVS